MTRTTSPRMINLAGKICGELTVVSYHGPTSYGDHYWSCVCSCGKEVKINGKNLRRGMTKSCGHIKPRAAAENGRRTRKVPGYSGLTKAYNNYRHGAKDRKYEWQLSREEFDKIVKQPCFYCNTTNYLSTVIQTTRLSTEGREHSRYHHNGIDRVDNSKGYVLDNCVACCSICNRAKGILDPEEFYAWIERVYANRKWA